MKVLSYEEVIKYLNEEHDINDRDYHNVGIGGIPYLDFWGWLFNAFGFLENKNFNNDGCEDNSFILNFDEKIKNQKEIYASHLKFYKETENKITVSLHNYISYSLKKGIKIVPCKTIEDIDKIEDVASKIVSHNFMDRMESMKSDIKQEKAENNPDWIEHIIRIIDDKFGEFKDSNGEYHMYFGSY